MKSLMKKLKKIWETVKSALTGIKNWLARFLKPGEWYKMSLLRKGLVLLGISILIIYPVSAFVSHKIDDDLSFAVAIEKRHYNSVSSNIIGLLHREIKEHTWIANKPWFYPQALFLDNMPNYQMGIVASLHGGATALAQTSSNDNLFLAAEKLGMEGNIWGFTRRNSVKNYLGAQRLIRENARDIPMSQELMRNLMKEFLHLSSSRIGESNSFIKNRRWLRTDNVFYFNRGMLYGMYIILRDAQEEFQENYPDQEQQEQMRQLLEKIRYTIKYEPLVIFAFSAKPSLLANHLLVQTYHMMLIRDAIREMLEKGLI